MLFEPTSSYTSPFQAAKAYEKHCEENGQPESHAKAKEILAGFSGAFIDRIVETKGVSVLYWMAVINTDCCDYLQLDFVDREKAKHHGGY